MEKKDEQPRSPVQELIHKIRQLLDKKSGVVSSIANPKLLLSALEELDALIDMESVKKSVVRQVQYLLLNSLPRKSTSQEDKAKSLHKFEGHVLHTVIYGAAGSGKTTVGCILAKIWIGIGLAKGGKASATTAGTQDKTGMSDRSAIEKFREAIFTAKILELRSNVSSQQTKMKKIRDHINRQRDVIVQMRRRIIRQDTPAGNKEAQDDWREMIRESREIRALNEEILKETLVDKDGDDSSSSSSPISSSGSRSIVGKSDEKSEEKEKSDEKKANDDDINNYMTIVSRADLVGEYQGHSAVKTLNLLKANLGKVVFIDEAYSLINGDRDNFGQEALTTLNQFMSEHPSEIVIIFAGYKELMKKTIFEAQPGLRRRCAWVFEITGYTPSSLSKIFKQQIEKNGWHIQDGVDLEQFFRQHEQDFAAFGGDTQRLTYFSKLTYSEVKFQQAYQDVLDGRETELDNIITKDMLLLALKDLNNNDSNKGDDSWRNLGIYT